MKKTKKIFITLAILACLAIFSSQTAFATTTSELDELLPSREQIPAQFHEVETENLNLNEDNFVEGRSITYGRLFENHLIMSLQFNVYEFTDNQSANAYYNKTVNEMKTHGGYLGFGYVEVEIPSAFAIIEEDQAEIANSWSVANNFVMNLEVFNDWDEDTEELLVTYTQLEMNIIPEFPTWTALPIFIIATLTAITIKKQFSHTKTDA